MGSYIPSTGDERLEMLKAIGLNTVEDLYAAVPESARLKSLNLPEGLSEMEVAACVSALAEKNKVFRSVFRGAG